MLETKTTAHEPIDPDDKPKGKVYEGSKRPLYFTEQYLVVEDFKDEAYYHLGLMHRHNRCLHTPGVVAGLEVTVEKDTPAAGKTRITVDKGTAIDHFGREVSLTEVVPKEFDTPAADTFWVALVFKEEKSKDDISSSGKQREKRAMQAPEVRLMSALPTWPKNPDDDPVIIYRWTKTAGEKVGAGARIPTGGALSFQQAVSDPADSNQRTVPPAQAGLDFVDGALRIRARVTDPVRLDTTHLVIQQATGNVGIGTTSPDAKLTIQQSDASKKALSMRKDDAGSVGLDFFFDSITAIGANQSLTIAASSTGSLLLNPKGGNLGIRTDALDLSSNNAVLSKINDQSTTKFLSASYQKGTEIKETDLTFRTTGVFLAMFKEATRPTQRLVIAGDVIILGKLLVADISEYGGRVFHRGGA